MKRLLTVGVGLFLLACEPVNGSSGSSSGGSTNTDATRVFETKSGATLNPRSLEGIWESAQPQVNGPLLLTSRFEFRPSFVVIAAKCTRDGLSPVIVGGRAAATVSAELIRTTQAVSDTKPIGSDAACQAASSAGDIPRCDPDTAPVSRNICFDLTGTTLDIYQSPGVIVSFNKIAD